MLTRHHSDTAAAVRIDAMYSSCLAGSAAVHLANRDSCTSNEVSSAADAFTQSISHLAYYSYYCLPRTVCERYKRTPPRTANYPLTHGLQLGQAS